MDFWQIVRIVQEKKWIVIAITLVATVATAVGFSLMAKSYRATAAVMPSDQAMRGPGASVTDVGYADPMTRQMRQASLIALAKSQTVADRAVKSLNWPISLAMVENNVSIGPVAAGEGRQTTDMLQIQGYYGDPQKSVELTNAVTRAFVEYYQELTHREAASNRQILEKQFEVARAKLSEAEGSLTNYKANQKLISLPDELNAALTGLGTIRQERDAAQAELLETDARLASSKEQLARTSATRVVYDDTENPLIKELDAQLAQLEGQQVLELAVHTPKFSRAKLLESQIASVKQRLAEEVKKSKPRERTVSNPAYENVRAGISTLEAERRAGSAKLAGLEGILAARQASVNSFAGADEKIAAYTREYRLAEDTYKGIVTRLAQARLNEKLSNDAGGITIVDLATTAEGPVKRGLTGPQMIVAAFLFSLLAGIGLVVAMEVLDNTIRTGKDAEDLTGLPVTALIPKLNSGRDTKALPIITHTAPSSPHAEAYRFLGTDLLFTAADSPIRTVMTATAKPGQGGTTTISNLAITIAQAGRRVVLVDADMRRPMLHDLFKVPNEIGLSTVLQEQASLADALQPTAVENLILLPGGPVPENPWKLLRSRRMRELIAALKAQCDFVFFDSPSAVVFADAAVIASMVDGVILVIRAQQSPRGNELQVRNLLNKAKANIIGMVLNDASPETVDSYHFHSRYYPNGETMAALDGTAGPKPLASSTLD